MRRFFLAAALLGLGACDNGAGPSTPSLESWLGRWNGPEGTYLDIARDGAQYDVTIRNLDGETKYSAIEQDGTLQFMRSEVGEAIKPGTGVETGMKWLADKQNCLVIKPGEGYCRD